MHPDVNCGVIARICSGMPAVSNVTGAMPSSIGVIGVRTGGGPTMAGTALLAPPVPKATRQDHP